MKAYLKYATVSYQKMLVVAKMVRGMSVKSSLDLLEHMPKKAWKILSKVIKTAVSNSWSKDWLSFAIDTVNVWKGPSIKRTRFASRARIHSYLKHRSYVEVVLK